MKLTQLDIQGFKSFGKEQNIRFGDISIFIGANGSGKSNLISFFEMLQWMINKKLEHYVAINDGASSFTHLGSVNSLVSQLTFDTETHEYNYSFWLAPTNANDFVFTGENLKLSRLGSSTSEHAGTNKGIDKISKESNLPESANAEKSYPFVKDILSFLKKSSHYQFQNTSSKSGIRQYGYINNTGYLMSDGGNLAALLHGLQQSSFNKYYDRIIKNIRLAYPSFDDFVLVPNAFNPDNVRLDWRDKNCPPNFRFSPQQLSDGTLRFMALAALLLQPPETIPKVIVIDEPELGLHPSAISILANMIHTASKSCQVVLATQSSQLLDYFEPEHIRVVDRDGSNSIVKEPSKEELEYWLQDYSLGQIWEKNIIGGRP